ncbi:hypothetical protein ACOMHN_011479 [Nucella lapillus]
MRGDVEELNRARDMQDTVETAHPDAGKDVPLTPAQPQPEEETPPGQPSETEEPKGDTADQNKSENNAAYAIRSEDDAKRK